MGTPLEEILEGLPLERRQKIEKRSAEIIAEEMTRQQLRQALKLTQEQIAQLLQVERENVSGLEEYTDFLLSTLRKHIEAMGGKLRLVVEFPDRPPVNLFSILDLDDPEEITFVEQELRI